MTTLHELIAQQADIEKQIAETRREERLNAIGKIRALLADHGLTVADINGVAERQLKKPVLAKFRSAETGAEWSGRGRQPLWLKAAMAAGKSVEDFRI